MKLLGARGAEDFETLFSPFFKTGLKDSSLHTVDVCIVKHLIYSLIKNGILVFL